MGEDIVKRVAVLMYHALWSDADDLRRIDPVDRPYALPLVEFTAQLDALREHGIDVLDPALLKDGAPSGGGVVLTFDDGHVSNARLALPELRRRGMRATFFITTQHVGRRAEYCSAEQLRELAAAGMSVGAHGHTHRFLNDLGDAELAGEVRASQEILRDSLGAAAREMSFPGGRFDRRCVDAAGDAGFEVLFGSAVGTLHAGAALPSGVLPRIAIRPGLATPVFVDFASGAALRIARSRAADAAKAVARTVLGNERYHRLYGLLRS